MFEQSFHSERKPKEVIERPYPASFDNLTPNVKKKLQMRWETANAHLRGDMASDNKISRITQKEFEDIENLMRPEQPEVKEIELDNMVVRLIYEAHGQEHSPLTVQKLDSFALEYNFSSGLVEAIKSHSIEYENLHDLGEKPGLDLIFTSLKDQMTPVLLIDVSDSPEFDEILVKEKKTARNISRGIQAVFTVAALASSYNLLDNLLSKTEENEKLSRRRFLQTLGVSTLATIGAVGDHGRLSMTGVATPEASVLRKLERGETQMKESLGILEIILTYRNAVMAQKLHTIAESHNKSEKKVRTNRKPHVGLLIGAGHSGIENMLKIPETERLAFIAKITRSLEKHGIKVDPADIVRLQYDRKGKGHLSYETDEKIQRTITARE